METKKIKRSYMDSFLDESEQQALVQFAADEIMFKAVKKVILSELYHNGTLKAGEKPDMLVNFAYNSLTRNPQVNDEEIGRNLRAIWQGVQLLDGAFGVLANYKTSELDKVEKNKNIGV